MIHINLSGITVSVIVLTYNHEKYIAQALDSILMQNVDFSYEILVGDDASTDDSVAILQTYAEQYPGIIRLYRHATNLGAARNAYELLGKAQGKYLAFCEGDDFWIDPNKLRRQVLFLEQNTTYIGCSHKCVIVDENGVPRDNQTLNWVRYRNPFTLDDFKGIYLPGQTATIVKRNIFRGNHQEYSYLYEINPNISDRTTTLLYLSKGVFGYLPEIMSAYRQTGTAGITHSIYANNPNRILYELSYTEKLEQLASSLSISASIFDDYYKQLYAWAVWDYLKFPSVHTKKILNETAKKLGGGLIHPQAFIRGLLQKKGII